MARSEIPVPAVIVAVLCFFYGIYLFIVECSRDCDRCSHHSSLTLRTPAYKVKAARILGVIQIICGIVSVAFGVWAIVLGTKLAYVALPISAGVAFYWISGTLGVLSGNKSNNLILANKWMSFCSLFLAFTQMTMYFLIALSSTPYDCDYYFHNQNDCSKQTSRFAVISIVLAVIGTVEFITAVTASLLAKHGVDTNKYLIEYDGPADQLEQRLPSGLTCKQSPVPEPNDIQPQSVIRQQGTGAIPAPMPPPPYLAVKNPVTGVELPPYSEGADLPSGIAGAKVGVSPGNRPCIIEATTEGTEPKPSFNYQELI